MTLKTFPKEVNAVATVALAELQQFLNDRVEDNNASLDKVEMYLAAIVEQSVKEMELLLEEDKHGTE